MSNRKDNNTIMPMHRAATVTNSLNTMGSLLSFLVNADETGGAVSVHMTYARRGSEPPPHVHHREHEIYYVIEGSVEFFVEGAEDGFLAKPGDLVFLPQGKAHALKLRSEELRALVIFQAIEGQSTAAAEFLKKVAFGPATSMDLPAKDARYATVNPGQMKAIIDVSNASGSSFLSREEAARRIPLYRGVKAAADPAESA